MSPQQKRSSQYDWFKGTPGKGAKKSPKESAKLVWKFTKIFIYLALFVFSMTGCIQTLIIKSSNTVGRGAEFYSSESEVAPHVTGISYEKIPDSTTTTSAKSIYEIHVGTENYWLNKDVKGEGSLEAVHKAIAEQSSKGTLKLEDAFKGSNEGLIIKKAGDPDTGLTMVTSNSGDKVPLVLSSLADKSGFPLYDESTDSDLLDGIIIFSQDSKTNGWSTTKLGKGTLKTFDVDYVYKLFNIFEKLKDADGNAVVFDKANYKFSDAKVNAENLITNTVWDKDDSKNLEAMDLYSKKVKAITNDYDKKLAINNVRQSYSLATLKYLLVNFPEATEWLKKNDLDSLSITGIATINDLMNANIEAKNPDGSPLYSNQEKLDITEAQRQIRAKSTYLYTITHDIVRLSGTDDAILGKNYHFTSSQYPFSSGSTDWRPLVTWGDAWGEGPFYGTFVYPVAYISANMINSMPTMSGWETLISMFVIVFSIRMLSFALSFKATMQQTKMQELSGKKAIIDAKYAAYKGNKQMENRQKQEVSEMYKKEGVSMFGSISTIFLTMPFFLAIWRTIGALPHIKSTVWLGINLSATSWKELFSGEFQYLPLMILAAGFAAFQQILPRLLTKKRDKNRINVHQKAAMKKSNKTQNIMMIVFVFMSIVFTAGLQVYWIAGGLWMTIQSYITHRLFVRESKNKKRRKIKA